MAARVPLPILPASFKKKKKEETNTVELEDITERKNEEEEDEEELHERGDGDGNAGNSPNQGNREEEDEEDESLTLDEHAEIVMAILKPVAVTMIVVIVIVFALHFAESPPKNIAFMVYQESSSDSTSKKLGGSLLNAFIFVAMIVVVTFVLVLLFKYRCMKIIKNWLMLSCAMLLGIFGGVLYYKIYLTFNWPLDWITFAIIVWNFSVVGMFSIFWRAPVKTTQFYLIAISALMACLFTRLAEWTTWTLLVAIAIYDLFAVLCPRGPLKMLVDLSQERGEPIPALLYSGMAYEDPIPKEKTEKVDETDDDIIVDLTKNEEEEEGDDDDDENTYDVKDEPEDIIDMEDDEIDNENSSVPLLRPQLGAVLNEEDIDDKIDYKKSASSGGSVKLGLGDFIFYSVLMGRAAMYDITTVFTCFIAIITGLFLTLILLAVFRKALPALPFSIFLGVIFYLVTKEFLVPFVQILSSNGVFV